MRLKTIFISLVILTILTVQTTDVFAFGQMTEPIVIENALRGNEYQETLIIVNTDNENISVNFSGTEDIAGWVKFYLPEDMENQIENTNIAPSSNKNVTAIFTIPEDAPNGIYKGIVNATKKAPEMSAEEGSSVSIAQAIGREATITVGGEEKIGLQVSVIPDSYDIKTNQPLNIRFIFDNLGNISLHPQIDLKIKDIDGKVVYNAIYPYPENEPSVRPNAQYEIPSISVPTNGLANGKYRADINFLHNNSIIFEKGFGFNISAKGFIMGISDIKINWYIIGGAILIILIALSLVLSKKFRTKKVNV